ncbi:LPXTG cell wall anchor domain-containing protein [Listeria sp. FSL L7-1517]|nr:LPXTG cell wall anchor domain-containing protein [Listeria immobilis]
MAAYMNGTIDAAGFEAAVGATPAQFDLDLIAENFEGYELDEAAYQANLDKMVIFEQNGGSVNLQVPFKKIAEVQAGADVTVKYVDADGNELAAAETLSGNVDETYTSEAKTIDGWTLKETPANASGTFSDQAQTVTYTYVKNEVNKGTVGISFVSEDGERQELVSSLNLSYAYPDGVPSNTVTFGELAEGATYNDLREGTLTTDKLWSDVLQNMVAYMNGTIDAAGFEAAVGATPAQFDLDLIAENFEGYEFDEAAYQANLDKMVIFEQNGGSVNLQVPFKKIAEVQAGADVTVKYVDADGNELAAAETLSGNVDETYTSEAKTIDGWTLKETPANASGTFSDQAQTVTYVYEKNADENVTPTPTPVDPDDNNTSTDEIGTHTDDNSETPSDNTSDTPTNNDTAESNSDSKSSNDSDVKDSTATTSPNTATAKTQTNTPAKTATMAKNSLPKTGDNALQSGLLVGIGALLLGGLWVFMRKTKKAK